MKKAKNPVSLAFALAMAEIKKLSQAQRIEHFVSRTLIQQRAFSEMGKLMKAISDDLKPKETIFGLLQKEGVKKGTISNAMYASKTFELVLDGHLTEAQYDSFTFQDCLSIVRVLGPNSAKRLSPEDLAVVIKHDEVDFAEELACLYENGVTLEEKAENDRLIADANANPPPATAPAPATVPAPAGSHPAAPAAAPAPAANAAPEGKPGNVVPMVGKPTAESMNRQLDQIETDFLELDEEAQILVGQRIIAMAETIFQFKDMVQAPEKELAAA